MYNLEKAAKAIEARTPRSCTIRRGASRTFVTVRVRASCTTSSKGTGSPTRPHARPWPLKWREEPTLRISLYDSEPSIPMTSRPGGTQPRTGSSSVPRNTLETQEKVTLGMGPTNVDIDPKLAWDEVYSAPGQAPAHLSQCR